MKLMEIIQKKLICDLYCFSIPNKESRMGKSKTIVPRNSTDRFLFLFMLIGIPFGVAWLGGVIMPHYHHTIDSTVVMHIVCAIFILYNIVHNMLLVIRTDASGRTSYLPSILKTGDHLCSIYSLICYCYYTFFSFFYRKGKPANGQLSY